MRCKNGPTATTSTGTPARTTAASNGEVVNRMTATTTYATTAPTPGPVTVRAIATVWTSLMPTVTISPALIRRASDAPSREVCQTVARTDRNEASIRTFVIVRCRAIASNASRTVTPNRISAHLTSAAGSRATSPASTARDNTHGGTVSPTIQTVPSNAPAETRLACDRVSQNRNRNGPAVSLAVGGAHVSVVLSNHSRM